MKIEIRERTPDVTEKYPEILEKIKALSEDNEMVITGSKKSFQN